MTLARITNYVDGNVLTGAQLNNEFDNILNNGPSLVSASIPAISMVQGLTGRMLLNIGSFAANAYQLKSSSTICTLSATSSYSINTQTAGPIANGRDQAAAFGSTDVHFYAITTGGTSTSAVGICSSVPPPLGPTLPAGYTAWAYLASVKYSTASSVVSFDSAVQGNRVFNRSPSAVLSSGADITGLSVLVDFTALVPAIAPTYTISVYGVGGQSPAAGGILDVDHFVRATSGGSAVVTLKTIRGSTTDTVANQRSRGAGGTFELPNINTPPSCFYGQVINTGTSAAMSIAIHSYTVPNGG